MLTPQYPRILRGGLLALLLAVPLVPAAAPFRPADDGQVLERVPVDKAGRTVQVTATSPEAAAAAAQVFIERARREGDPRWLGYAQSALTPWWNQPRPPDPVLLLRATLRQSAHDFEASLDDLALLLQRNPRNAQAWLTRATILRVMGRYSEARSACLRLVGLADDFVPVLCTASIKGLNGELAAALVQVQALEEPSRVRPPDVRAWYWAEYTEMLERSGATESAAGAYRRALALDPNDLGLRIAYVDFLLDQGQASEALALTTRQEGDSNVDALRLRRLLAQRQLHSVDARLQALVSDGFAATWRRGDNPHLREEARYALFLEGDTDRALALALRNWQTQREPWDTRLLLAAAKAAGQPDAAGQVREWIHATGYEDARLSSYLNVAP